MKCDSIGRQYIWDEPGLPNRLIASENHPPDTSSSRKLSRLIQHSFQEHVKKKGFTEKELNGKHPPAIQMPFKMLVQNQSNSIESSLNCCLLFVICNLHASFIYINMQSSTVFWFRKRAAVMQCTKCKAQAFCQIQSRLIHTLFLCWLFVCYCIARIQGERAT